MGIKDLFEKPQQILTSAEAEETTKEKVESLEYLDAALRAKEEFVPFINFSSASNFARYGSAEKYYEDALATIYREYPYDGTSRELKEYNLKLNYLSRHVLESLYPRTTGHITLGTTGLYTGLSGSYGILDASSPSDYIAIVGGPHTASHIQSGVEGMADRPLHETFKYSNRLSEDPFLDANLRPDSKRGTQLSNLRFNPSTGITVEFWLKKDGFDALETEREVLFDLWNGKDLGSTPDPASGRLLLELTSSESPIRLTYRSGSTTIASNFAVAATSVTTATVANNTWNHYALSIKSDIAENETAVKLYVNGALNKYTKLPGYLNEVTGGLNAHIGALCTGTQLGGDTGLGALRASMDEFRFWKTSRTSEQIGRNWWTQIHGGTNKEPYNTSLGVYYKFNEGVVQSSSADTAGYNIDKTVLDYSGRVSNGQWVNYPGYEFTPRSTDSAMVLSNAAPTEFNDPIIYPTHHAVVALKTELKASGSLWDDQNNASILNSIPTFLREEDETIGDGSLTNVLQLMGSYFDKIQHLIDALPQVRANSYLTSSAKPYPFATHLLESVGLNAPDMFVNANVL